MDPFLERVEQEAARRFNRVFVLDSGEGREMENAPDGMDVEDLSGWMLTLEQAEAIPHSSRAERDALFERDDLEFVFVKWREAKDDISLDFIRINEDSQK